MWSLFLVTSSLLGLLHSLFVAHDSGVPMHLAWSAGNTLVNAKVVHEMNLVLTKVLMLRSLRTALCSHIQFGSLLLSLTWILVLHQHLAWPISTDKVAYFGDIVIRSSIAAYFLASNDPCSSLLLDLALRGFLVLFTHQIGITGPFNNDRIVHIWGLWSVLFSATDVAPIRKHADVIRRLNGITVGHRLVGLSHLSVITVSMHNHTIIRSIRHRVNSALVRLLLIHDQNRWISSFLPIFRTITVLDSVWSFWTRLYQHALTQDLINSLSFAKTVLLADNDIPLMPIILLEVDQRHLDNRGSSRYGNHLLLLILLVLIIGTDRCV